MHVHQFIAIISTTWQPVQMASQAKISPMKDNSETSQRCRRSHEDTPGGAAWTVQNLFGVTQLPLITSKGDISLEGMEEGRLNSSDNSADVLAAFSSLKVTRKLVHYQTLLTESKTSSDDGRNIMVRSASSEMNSNDISPIKQLSMHARAEFTDSGTDSLSEESKDFVKELLLSSDSEKMSAAEDLSNDMLTPDEKEYIANEFLRMADPKTETLTVEGFCYYFANGNEAKAQNMLKWFDVDFSGGVTLDEFMDGMEDLERSNWQTQAKFEFMCMSAEQETLSESDLYELYRNSLRDSSVPEETIVKLSKTLLRALQQTSAGAQTRDPTPRSHRVGIDQFLRAIEDNAQLTTFFKFSANRFMQRAKRSASGVFKGHGKAVYFRGMSFNKRAACGFIAAYALASVALLLYTVVTYQALGASVQVQVARVGGAQLNLHTLLLLLSMCQSLHLFIASRSMLLSQLMALDFSVQLHKLYGKMTFLWAVIHIGGHLANYAVNRRCSALCICSTVLLRTGTGLTGTALMVLLVAIGAGYALRKRNSVPIMLWQRGFELFYLSHRLTPVYAAVMIAHAPSCRYWLLPPLTLLLLEWAQRCIRARAYRTYPAIARRHASGVTELVLKRPAHMGSYQAGSYVQLCIPQLSAVEWHPFSLTSAPDRRDGTLSVHIKSREKGSWTDQLACLVERRVRDSRRERVVGLARSRSYSQLSCISSHALDEREYVRELADVTVYVRGPIFGPSAHIFSYEHVVYVAGGIGVTPFAGILEAIVMRCNNSNISDYGLTNVHALGTLKVVHFLWLLNDMESTSWFTSLLAAAGETRLKNDDLKKLFHFQIYLTSVVSGTKEDTLFVISLAALCGIAEKEQRDLSNPLLGGLKERTHVGRPKWPQVLGKIKSGSQHKDSIGLFYCGPPAISGDIAAACADLQMDFRSEYFD